MRGRDWRLFGRIHAALYKLLGGRFVGGVGLGRKVLLLSTTGRRSGVERTTPLVYMPYGEHLIVYPSNGGKETQPAWWLNLQSDPLARVQLGNEQRQVQARQATQEEYEAIWPAAEQYNPHWRDYARTVRRPIPLVMLERVDVEGRMAGRQALVDSRS